MCSSLRRLAFWRSVFLSINFEIEAVTSVRTETISSGGKNIDFASCARSCFWVAEIPVVGMSGIEARKICTSQEKFTTVFSKPPLLG